VRGIGEKQHNVNKFVILAFYLPTDAHLVAHFKREIQIVDGLDANALIGLDIAVPEGWNIDLDAQEMTLPYCYQLVAISSDSSNPSVPASP
jgi:hypothetical protein